MSIVRYQIRVCGVVQGVGFRPFVWRLARDLGCSGFVYNDSSGVSIEVQGSVENVVEFQRRLVADAPSASCIAEVVDVLCTPTADEIAFEILGSQQAEKTVAVVSPDISVCEQCLRELQDSTNRRFCYPFINCTNCGPRFTIVESLPYDRSRTSMRGFELCAACSQEYHSPADRRFHAEPNACPDCGPRIWFVDSEEQAVEPQPIEFAPTKALNIHLELARTRDVLETVQSRIARGQIIAIKGVGGFHLACDATNLQAIKMLRGKKQRPDKPFAVMVAGLDACKRFAVVNEEEAKALSSPQRPIVLLEKHVKCDWIEAVAPGNPCVGVMLAYSPLHYLLVPSGQVWVMTSGNLSEEPIAFDNRDAWSRLAKIADGFLFHNRPISVACDDSVLRLINKDVLPIRRSRGFTPWAVSLHPERDLRRAIPTVLAVGGELKATVCLAIDSQAFLSQHIGDMGNEESQMMMDSISNRLLQLYQAKADIIAADLHPGYLSVHFAEKLASQLSIPLIKTQHHHAHAASLIAEHGLSEHSRIIACVFDGTGYGADGTIWGGEWLIASTNEYQRFGHLRRVPLPGGDACILRPARSALAHLYNESIEWTAHLACVQSLTPHENTLLRKQLDQRAYCTDTSSMGRLFDAIASLIGGRQKINYEGQAAIELESLAATAIRSANRPIVPYPFHWEESDPWELRLGEMLQQVISDRHAGVEPGAIAARFHQTLACATLAICEKARTTTGIQTVGLTGGVFQNVLLTQLVKTALENGGFRVLTHRRVPPNDAGLSLGQAAIARAQSLAF